MKNKSRKPDQTHAARIAEIEAGRAAGLARLDTVLEKGLAHHARVAALIDER